MVDSKEEDRIALLHELDIMDTLPQTEFDIITELISQICDVPIALISLVDDRRQWFKSKIGLGVDETSKDISFCKYTIAQKNPLIVTDVTKDERFQTNVLVTKEPHIRFYAGAPLQMGDHNLGSLCAIDTKPRSLTQKQVRSLEVLSDVVIKLIEYNKYKKITGLTLEHLVNVRESRNLQKKIDIVKSFLISNLSHEVKTPLNGIISTLDAMKETPKDTFQTDYLQILQQCTDDLITIFSNIMDFTQDIILNEDTFHLLKWLNNVIQNISYKSQEKLIELTTNIRIEDELQITADQTRILTLINNLMSNAVKFTKPGGKITVEATVSTTNDIAHFTFMVSDTGIGISQEHSKYIFKPLSQVDMTSTKNYKGLGNGLAIVKKIVEAMHGTVDFSSKLGEGSTFWFTIPLKITHEIEKVEKNILTSALVVDDNALNRKIATALLKKYCRDINIDTAENGSIAVTKAKGNNHDLILMDCQMPVKDGYEATNEIRLDQKDTVILALTASTENEDLKRCFQVGMDDVISKPITFKIIKEKLNKFFIDDCNSSE